MASSEEISTAAGGHGWRFVLGALRSHVRVGSLAQAASVVAALAFDDRVRLDLRPDRVLLTAPPDIPLAERLSAAAAGLGLVTDPGLDEQPVQALEIAIDALDIPAVRPFWRAVLGYVDEPGPGDALVDPRGQGPTVWFQQMDAPRPQRNRIHLDVTVPHDDAEHRRAAALAAGGVLVSAKEAPAFWVLADVEGNEACITTWQGRDG